MDAYQIVDILIGMIDRLTRFSHLLGHLYRSPRIGRLGLGWTAEKDAKTCKKDRVIEDDSGLQIQSKKAHHLELRLAGLVGDECTGIINGMKHPRNNCHGDDSGARAALYHGSCLLGNLFRLQHVQSCNRNRQE